MKSLVFAFGLLAMAGSVSADNKFHRWTHPLPENVEKNLPANIPARDVLTQDGCFFYVLNGKVYQILQQSGGAAGLPVCIG